MSEPVCVHADIRHTDKSSQRAVKYRARYEVFHLGWITPTTETRRHGGILVGQPWFLRASVPLWWVFHAHIEIQDFFPHRREKTKMALLPCVLLCDLQLDRLIRAAQAAKQGRCRLAYLEVDGPILDLNDDVVVKLSIERMEIVIGGLGAVIFLLPPVKMVVVNKGAIENDAAMRLERPGDGIRGVRRRAVVRGRTKLP